MREIKFRGKRVDNGELVYGGVETKFNGDLVVIYDESLPFDNEFRVIPESVGQFTGLHDKNNTEIYEDDVIEWYFVSGKSLKGKVLFINGRYAVESQGKFYDIYHVVYNFGGTILGDIHSNPSLLEVQP